MKHTIALISSAIISIPALAATWEGTDNFTSGISSNWTVNQSANGTMTVSAANGHASYLVASASASQQEADLLWKGTPSAAQDWTADIAGYNAANYSGNGSSQLQLWVIDMSALKGIRISMTRDSSGQVFNTKNESGVLRQSLTTTNANFGLRLVYRASAQQIEAWCDSSGVGTNWSKLDTIGLSTFSPIMTSTDVFTIAVIANTYYGPVSEGQLYADNFSITNLTIPSTNTNDPVFITNQPVSVSVTQGSDVSFSVGAKGAAPLVYQWTKDGLTLAAKTNAILTISNVQPVNIGSYCVTVSDSYGSTITSSNVSLNIIGVYSGIWSNLIAYYPFNGNSFDESGKGNNGVNNGAILTTDRYGYSGNAYYFNGHSYFKCPNIANIPKNSSPRTLSLWCKSIDGKVHGAADHIAAWGTMSSGQSFGIMLYNLYTVTNHWHGYAFGATLDLDSGITADAFWHHLVATYDGTAMKIYVDGVHQSSRVQTLNTIGADLYIGTRQDLASFCYFFGSIDDIRVYNRALSSNDVAQLYGSEMLPPTPPTIVTQPVDFNALGYNAASFSTVAFGSDPLHFQWTFNGTNLSNTTNASLTISSARQSDLGQYSVIVTNAYGSVTSSIANLFMYPYLNAPFTGVVTYWGQTNTLSVGAWGSGNLSYQWYFNDVALNGATNPTLPLGAIQFTNAGLYGVVVSSDYGSVTNAACQVVVNAANVDLGIYPAVGISGTIGYSYLIQSSTNLGDTNAWLSETNVILSAPYQKWSDYSGMGAHKFYRVLPGQ